MAITLGVVVVGVDHDLARERRHRHVAVVLERYGDHDDVARLAASTAVAARAVGPSPPTSVARVSGPRELLITTGIPR